MRIGLVCPYSFDAPGGVQNHVLGLAGWLRHAGHEPLILAPGKAPADVLARRGLTTDVVSSTGGAWPIRWNGSVARISGGPWTAARVRGWLARSRVDVLHLHEPITPSAAFWALALSRSPVVATFHQAAPRARALSVAGRALGSLVRRIDVPLAVSATAAAVVADHLDLSAAIVPNGIDVSDFSGVRSSGPVPRLVFLGRLTEPRKGLEVLLEAVGMIRAAVGEIDVVVAGPGTRELPAGVRHVGAPDDQARAALLRSADLFVAPHTGRESFGLVLLEAMAAGTPVVAADLAAFREVLTGPDGALLGRTFPIGSPRGLADAVIAALADPAPEREVLAARARSFDWSVVGPRVLEAYEWARLRRSRGQ